jgi:hypothetical protein
MKLTSMYWRTLTGTKGSDNWVRIYAHTVLACCEEIMEEKRSSFRQKNSMLLQGLVYRHLYRLTLDMRNQMTCRKEEQPPKTTCRI